MIVEIIKEFAMVSIYKTMFLFWYIDLWSKYPDFAHTLFLIKYISSLVGCINLFGISLILTGHL